MGKLTCMSEEELCCIHEAVKREREERKRREALIRRFSQRKALQEKGVHCTLLSPTSNCLQCHPQHSTVKERGSTSGALKYSKFKSKPDSTEKSFIATHTEENKCEVGIGSKEEKRVEESRQKLRVHLGRVVQLVTGEPTFQSPLDPDHAAKLRRRISEFIARFSRVFLYQIKIQLSEFEEVASKNCDKDIGLVLRKCNASHQTAVIASQALEKNIPGYFVDGVQSQVMEFYSLLNKLISLTESSLSPYLTNHTNQLEGLCGKVLEELRNWEGERGAEGRWRPHPGAKAKRNSKRSLLQNRSQHDRFHMYVGTSSWRSKTAALAMSKFGAPPLTINKSKLKEIEGERMVYKGRWKGGRQRVAPRHVDNVNTVIESIPPDSSPMKSVEGEIVRLASGDVTSKRDHSPISEECNPVNVKLILMKEDEYLNLRSDGKSRQREKQSHISDMTGWLGYRHQFSIHKSNSQFYLYAPLVQLASAKIAEGVVKEVGRQLECETILCRLLHLELDPCTPL